MFPHTCHVNLFALCSVLTFTRAVAEIHSGPFTVYQLMILQALLRVLQGILQSMGCGGWLSSPPPAAGATARDVAIGSIEQGPYVATWMQQIDALTPNRFSRCAQMLIEWGCKVDARWGPDLCSSECLSCHPLDPLFLLCNDTCIREKSCRQSIWLFVMHKLQILLSST